VTADGLAWAHGRHALALLMTSHGQNCPEMMELLANDVIQDNK
jgi:hypothetical protein